MLFLTISDEMFSLSQTGLIRKDAEEYFIEPYYAAQANSSGGQTHVLYKRSAIKSLGATSEGTCGTAGK